MYYFNPKDVANLLALNKVILFFIADFNNTRPMGVLKGFTPHEVYTNTKPLIDFKADQVKAALLSEAFSRNLNLKLTLSNNVAPPTPQVFATLVLLYTVKSQNNH